MSAMGKYEVLQAQLLKHRKILKEAELEEQELWDVRVLKHRTQEKTSKKKALAYAEVNTLEHLLAAAKATYEPEISNQADQHSNALERMNRVYDSAALASNHGDSQAAIAFVQTAKQLREEANGHKTEKNRLASNIHAIQHQLDLAKRKLDIATKKHLEAQSDFPKVKQDYFDARAETTRNHRIVIRLSLKAQALPPTQHRESNHDTHSQENAI